MTRFRSAATLLALVVITAQATAADVPLAQFPTSTDVLVRIKSPKATLGKVGDLVDNVQPGFGAMVRENATALGQLISNPTLAGVDQAGNWYLGVFTNEGDEPSVVFAVPTTDAEAAKAAIPESFSSKEVDGWLFYSEDEEALPEDSAPEASIESVMRGEPTAVFARGDIGVFVNIAHLTTAHAAEIEAGQQQATAFIENMESQIPQTPGIDMSAMMDIYKQLADHLFQGIKDSQQVTVIANFEDDGIVIEDFLSFTPSSITATATANHPRSDMKNASRLPAESVIIFGASTDMKRLMEYGFTMLSQMFSGNPQVQKSTQQFKEAAQSVKFGSVLGALSFGSAEEGIIRSVGLTEVTPAETWKKASREITKSSGTMELNGFKQETILEPDSVTIGDVKADTVIVKQEYDENAVPTGMQKQMHQMLFGPEGMKSLVVYQNDKVIQTMGGSGTELMSKTLEGLKSTNPVQPTTFRKGLIPDPNVLFLIDIPGLMIQGLKAASAVPGLPIPINADTLDNIKVEKSFVGFTAAVEKDAVRAKTRIPATQIQSVIAVVGVVQAMQQQQFQQN